MPNNILLLFKTRMKHSLSGQSNNEQSQKYLELSSSTGSSAAREMDEKQMTIMMHISKYLVETIPWTAIRTLKWKHWCITTGRSWIPSYPPTKTENIR